MEYTLECCVDSCESALEAEKGGATRLELCANLIIGGTSPSLALFEQIRKRSAIRIHVLLRPRFGDFLYTQEEFEILLREVALFRDAGAEGVVIGCLKADGGLDMERMDSLIQEARGMSITLHRAFDVCADPIRALEQAKELGIHTILTSGSQASALEGKELLKTLSKQAGKVELMAGAGVNADTIQMLLQETSLHSFHMSGKKTLQSGMTFRNHAVSMGLPSLSEFEIWRTDAKEIKRAADVLNTFFRKIRES